MADALSDVTLAILAGGAGSRMGKPKGLLQISGRPILEWMLDRIAWPGPTLLVTAPGREQPPGWERFNLEVSDPIAGEGPLRGIVTAMESTQTDRTLILPVDMPFFSRLELQWLAGQHSTNGTLLKRSFGGQDQIEPMPLFIRRSALTVLQSRLREGRASVRDLATVEGFNLAIAPADWDDQVWSNLNSPEDLRHIRG